MAARVDVVRVVTAGLHLTTEHRHFVTQAADNVIRIHEHRSLDRPQIGRVQENAASGESGEVDLIDGAVNGIGQEQLFCARTLLRRTTTDEH